MKWAGERGLKEAHRLEADNNMIARVGKNSTGFMKIKKTMKALCLLSLSLSLSSFYSSLFPFDKESNYLGLFSDTHTYIHIQRYFKYLCTVFITLMYRIKPSYMHIYVYRKYIVRYIGRGMLCGACVYVEKYQFVDIFSLSHRNLFTIHHTYIHPNLDLRLWQV